MDKEFFSDFSWHSSFGIDETVKCNNYYTKLKNNKKARSMFISAGDNKLLIHKTTQALWKVSADGNYIEPVFESDILTAEDLENSIE